MNINKIKIGIILVVVAVILLSFIPMNDTKTEQRLEGLNVKDIKSLVLSNYSLSTTDKFMVLQKGKTIEIKDKNRIDEFYQSSKSLKGVLISHPGVIGTCLIEIKSKKSISFRIIITEKGQVLARVPGKDWYNYRISDEFTSFIKGIITDSGERNPTWTFPRQETKK